MALQLTSALTDGLRRVVTRTGGVLFAALLATQLLLISSINTVIGATAPAEVADQIGLTLPVSRSVAIGLALGTYLLTAAYFVVVSRALTRPRRELSTFPAALYTRRIGRATLSMIVGGAVVAVAVVLGLIFFVLPGLFFAACFLFFIFAVGVEDRGVVGGLKRSWGLSQGNRLRLVALVFFAGLVGSVVGAVPAIFQAAGEPVVGQLVAVVINSLLFVVIYGIMAAAYLQAGGSRRGPGSAGGTAGTSGALDSSW